MSEPRHPQKGTNVRLSILGTSLRLASALSPTFAARWLSTIFLKTRRHRMPEQEYRWLASGERSTFESRGRRLSSWSWGGYLKGPTVLLAHGWEGRGAQMGAFVKPLLALGFRVVTFDAPGHGRSPGRRSSLIEIADAIVDADRHFGPFHGVAAHSLGAAATTIAIKHGIEVERLVFVAPTADPGAFLFEVARALGLPPEIAASSQRRIEQRFRMRWEGLRPLSLAPMMTAPLLVIHDRDDREVDVDNARQLASAWPGSELEVTSGLGHRRILKEPDVLERAVSFLSEGISISTLAASGGAIDVA